MRPVRAPTSPAQVFRPRTPNEATDLVSKILKYTPTSRLTPVEAMAHEFFDELREPQCVLPSKTPLPPLFDFTEAELQYFGAIKDKLLPKTGEKSSDAAAKASTSEALPEDLMSSEVLEDEQA